MSGDMYMEMFMEMREDKLSAVSDRNDVCRYAYGQACKHLPICVDMGVGMCIGVCIKTCHCDDGRNWATP